MIRRVLPLSSQVDLTLGPEPTIARLSMAFGATRANVLSLVTRQSRVSWRAVP
jgi:hypothetical protein